MGRRSLALLGAAMALALNACGDQPEPGISGPTFAPPVPPPPTACNFDLIKSGITAYFAAPQPRQTVQGLKDQMEIEWNTAGHETQTRNIGFDIMREISLAANSGTAQGTPAEGSALTNATFRCMFFNLLDTNKFPTFPINFAPALTPSSGGAYYVRGGASDNTSNVVGSDAQGNISAIAPDPSWTGSMSARALIFGEPIPAAFAGYKGYDWVVLPTDVTFNPQASVGLCFNDARDFSALDVPISVSTESMVLESSVGVLAWDGALALTICSSQKPLALLDGEARSHGPIQRLARYTFGLLSPQPLYASALVATATTIGKVSGVKSKFTKLEVFDVGSKWMVEPPRRPKEDQPFTVEIEATTIDEDGIIRPALGVCYKLTGSTNSGTPQQAQLVGAHTCGSGTEPSGLTTLASGKAIATITATPTQNGGIIITASGNVVDRTGTVAPLTFKANVIP